MRSLYVSDISSMRLTFCKVRATIELDLAAFENVEDVFPPCNRFDIVGFCC